MVMKLKLKNYRQQDAYSCGLVAALSVVHYFDSVRSKKEVLSAVRPTKSSGVGSKELRRGLRKLSVDAVLHKDLTLRRLREYVACGVPVIVTVWPEEYETDHWTVVQGFVGDRIHLTNYKSMPVRGFKEEWFEVGEGLVCKPISGD
jgi:hypothetical protein